MGEEEEKRGEETLTGGRDRRRRERTRDIDEAESGMEKKDAAKEGLKGTERGTREWAAGSWAAALQHFLIASMMLGGACQRSKNRSSKPCKYLASRFNVLSKNK